MKINPAIGETFFTRIGCMDGRLFDNLRIYGQQKFGAIFPDTITDAGSVGIIANNPSEEFLEQLKKKLDISIQRHKSKGIVVHGHQECAGNSVPDGVHKQNILKSVKVIQQLAGPSVPVVGVFVKRSIKSPTVWQIEEL